MDKSAGLDNSFSISVSGNRNVEENKELELIAIIKGMKKPVNFCQVSSFLPLRSCLSLSWELVWAIVTNEKRYLQDLILGLVAD